MNALRIFNYEILNFDQEPMVFSSTGFTKITEPKIIRALQTMGATHAKYINLHELEQIFETESLEPKSALNFLESLSILGKKVEPPHFQKVIIYHDLDISTPLKDFYEKKHNSTITFKKIEQFEVLNHSIPTLFIFACLKLRPDAIRSHYTRIMKENPEHGASIGFISNHHFHLTEVHVPSIGNPCAFCTLDRVTYYESKRASQHPWSKVWAFCCRNNYDLPKTDVDDLQTSLILGTIISFTNKLTLAPKFKYTQDQVLLSKTIDLDTGATTEEISTHWPFCQCLGK
ncbi:McbB family protein [Pseudomonas vlassakiae]|uniref:McbB family protein n=1 Tax=Pseudomonas vlassakiae TaxID=485888 RepID=UPI0021CA3252|nr:McbB family protein [Pseudomonas vlassakiae]MCU0126568.1 McbB family protein [Pseudomonas vlassakiae]